MSNHEKRSSHGPDIPPTGEWYASTLTKIHEMHQQDFAKGLNVSRTDLYRLQLGLMRFIASVRASEAEVTPRQNRLWHLSESAYVQQVRNAHSKLPAKFPGIAVPSSWLEQSLPGFVQKCEDAFEVMISKGTLDGRTGSLTNEGRKVFHRYFHGSIPKVAFDFDCMEKVLAWSGLRPKTMRNVVKYIGFDGEDGDRLLRGRCDPVFFGELVANPPALLMAMHDCEVLLVGSRAAKYFYPRLETSESDWDFLTHPHALHWLKFAVYLSSIGTTWEFPDWLEGDDEPPPIYESHTLCGTVERNGKRHKLHLIAHFDNQVSSTHLMLDFHSSFVQCFISGFGAVSMYGNLTAAGCSRAWEPKDWFCEYLRQANQEAVDKYVRRGIKYVARSELPAPPHILPVPRSRYLGDSLSVCISFEDYIKESLARNTGDADLVKARVDMVREDFCLLHFVQWFERPWQTFHPGYKTVHSPERFPREQYKARENMRRHTVTEGPEFKALIEIAECSMCDVSNSGRHVCSAHDNIESDYRELLAFFCDRINYNGFNAGIVPMEGRWNWRDRARYPYI